MLYNAYSKIELLMRLTQRSQLTGDRKPELFFTTVTYPAYTVILLHI